MNEFLKKTYLSLYIKNQIELMEERKTIYIQNITSNLLGKVENAYIIGSFMNENWNPEKSDIDIIVIDSSFDKYPLIYSKKYILSLLNFESKKDVYLYTQTEFDIKYQKDPLFKKNIDGGLKLF